GLYGHAGRLPGRNRIEPMTWANQVGYTQRLSQVGLPQSAPGDHCKKASDEWRRSTMPSKSANVKNEKQYEALKDKGMSKERAARIANSPDASSHGGKKSHSGSSRSSSSQGGTTAQKKAAGRKGGKATARKHA